MKPRKPQHLQSLRERGLAKQGAKGLRLTEKGREELKKKIGIDLQSIVSAWSQRLRSKNENERGWLRAYSHILPVLEKRLGGLKGKKILEIGYGNPWFMDILHEAGAEAVGLDPKPVRETKHRVLPGTVENLGQYFKGEKFDAIVAKNILTNFILGWDGRAIWPYKNKISIEDRKTILRMLHEKLRPGGVLVVQDIDAPVNLVPIKEFEKCGFSVFVRKSNNIYARLVIALKTGK